jgi:hypothetical protein
VRKGGHDSALSKLVKLVRKLSPIDEFDLLHADGIRHADLDAGVRVLNELIFECQRRLEGIEHARLDLEARGWAKARGMGGTG